MKFDIKKEFNFICIAVAFAIILTCAASVFSLFKKSGKLFAEDAPQVTEAQNEER